MNKHNNILQSRRSCRAVFSTIFIVIVTSFTGTAGTAYEVDLAGHGDIIAQAGRAMPDEVKTQRMRDPETGRDITGEYIAEKLKYLEKIADRIIQHAADEFLRRPDKKQEIYERAYQEIHQRLGMGSIGPATAAAGPLMTQKKARLAELLDIKKNDRPGFAHQELLPFEKDGRWGYRDEHGDIAIKNKYRMAYAFLPGGIAAVIDDQGWAYIDRKGGIVLRPFIFDNGPDYFREGLARFTVDYKFGFFNERGEVIIKPRFDFAFPFSEGLSPACMGCLEKSEGEHSIVEGGAWGYIDNKGDWVISPIFGFAGQFEEGKAQVKLNGRCVFIDKRGKITSDCKEKRGQERLKENGKVMY